MDEPEVEEDCALCGLLLGSAEVITLKRPGGVTTCNNYAKKRKLDLKFTVSKIVHKIRV